MNLRQECGVQENALFIEIDQVRLAYCRKGQGRPLVCLHAIGHGSRDFESFSDLVHSHFEVITLDWPNHGRSSDDHCSPSAIRYADLLVKFLDELNIQNPIILGNSVSGAVAMLYAQQKPVSALVLCDSAGLVPINPFIKGICTLFSAFFNAGAQGKQWFARAYRLYYELIVLPSRSAKPQRERIIASGYELAATLRDAWISFGQSNADLRAVATELDVPILCAWASSDRVIPLWMCKFTIRKMRQAQLIQFDAGHSVFLEQPQAFAKQFLAFTNQLKLS
ncbi:MAG: hypothetical protein NVS3B3_24190 [Aquirhabdus sp.]